MILRDKGATNYSSVSALVLTILVFGPRTRDGWHKRGASPNLCEGVLQVHDPELAVACDVDEGP